MLALAEAIIPGTSTIPAADDTTVREVAGALTPVPGGVGPMTIAMLLRNTATAAQGR